MGNIAKDSLIEREKLNWCIKNIDNHKENIKNADQIRVEEDGKKDETSREIPEKKTRKERKPNKKYIDIIQDLV